MAENALISSGKSKLFNGFQYRCRAFSRVLQAETAFHLYLPPMCAQGYRVPVLLWLADGEGGAAAFAERSDVQRFAAQWGMAVLVPEVSARYGQGAACDYLSGELPDLIGRNFPTDGAYSLGGHGAGALQALHLAADGACDYAAVSMFSPFAWLADGAVVAQSPLGGEADFSDGIKGVKILCDTADAAFLPQTAVERQAEWLAAVRAKGVPILHRARSGYAPNVGLLASFIDSHVEFHADALGF